MNMRKSEFVERLRWFSREGGVGLPDEHGHPDYRGGLGAETLAGMLARWLEEAPGDDGARWLGDLPLEVAEAFSAFSAGGPPPTRAGGLRTRFDGVADELEERARPRREPDPRWEVGRAAYRAETGRDVPDLVDAYAGGLHRTLVVHEVCRLLPLLARAPWLRERLEVKLRAQDEVVDHAWRRFVVAAYREVMPRIRDEANRGNSGTFGRTRLLTFDLAGRVTFTFRRGGAHVTYVADASDMVGHRSGPNPLGAPYHECVSMIDDVVDNWRAGDLRRDDGVSVG